MTFMQLTMIPRTGCCLALLTGSALMCPAPAAAATPAAKAAPAAKPASKAAAKAARTPRAAKAAAAPAPAPAPLLLLPEADAVQLDAAERVYYGNYECEFKQSITLHSSPKYLAYVDLTHGKSTYLMKPVLSSTGAIRLEDVMGATLMVQISNKSMLLDVKGGRRLVDECVSPKQRELIEAARQARATAALEASQEAARSASAASAPAPAN